MYSTVHQYCARVLCSFPNPLSTSFLLPSFRLKKSLWGERFLNPLNQPLVQTRVPTLLQPTAISLTTKVSETMISRWLTTRANPINLLWMTHLLQISSARAKRRQQQNLLTKYPDISFHFCLLHSMLHIGFSLPFLFETDQLKTAFETERAYTKKICQGNSLKSNPLNNFLCTC